MKQILFSLLFIATVGINAQITVNTIDLNVGDVVLQAIDTTYQTDLYAPGTNLTWDFSGVHGHTVDTIAPIDPATTNHASSFPQANMALGTVELAGYANLGNDWYVSLGYGGYIDALGQDLEMILADPDSILSFPINYGQSRNCNSWGTAYAAIQGQDLRASSSVKRTQVIDAWGTATTPEGTFNVLRMHEQVITIDSVFAIIYGFEMYQPDYSNFDTSYFYNFYTNDATIKYPLLEVQYDPADVSIIQTKWVTFPEEQNISTINESSKLNFYPNPAQDFIYLNQKVSKTETTIFSVDGRILIKSTDATIDISSLKPATYVIRIENENGATTQKLIKQ
ncbi:MAG: T9SS type A sorting domain-containing protein [Bacteroidales bacterium]|nr:T9SS type A sorting domain-containing protein [Bacteroidales bacterium]